MASEISREALIVYLENLRTLETILHISQKKFQELEQQKNRLVFTEQPPQEPYAPESMFGLTLIFGFAAVIICAIILAIPILGDILSFFLKYLWWIIVPVYVIVLIATLISSASEKKEYQKNRQNYTAQMAAYEQRRNAELPRLAAEKNRIEELQNEIQKDIETVSKALERAYSANIVPLQFRNITGVYYLYDYISTSGENLTTALVQANLEDIKNKLNSIIQLQGEQILLQEQANRMQFQHNQNMLESSRRIEENSRVAAQYGQIAALNSETSVMLQREQLAYQKADYYAKSLGLY